MTALKRTLEQKWNADSFDNQNESFEKVPRNPLQLFLIFRVDLFWNSHAREEWMWALFVSLLISPTVQSAKPAPSNDTSALRLAERLWELSQRQKITAGSNFFCLFVCFCHDQRQWHKSNFTNNALFLKKKLFLRSTTNIIGSFSLVWTHFFLFVLICSVKYHYPTIYFASHVKLVPPRKTQQFLWHFPHGEEHEMKSCVKLAGVWA